MELERYYYKNSVELQGTVVSQPTTVNDRETLFTVRTIETVNSNCYMAEHSVRINGSLNVQKDDFCIINGAFTEDVHVVSDHSHVRNLGCLATAELIFKNHIVLHGCVSSDIRQFSTGYSFDLYTEIASSDTVQLLKSLHVCMAFGRLAPFVVNTRKGDFVMVEGHIASNKKIIISKFNNITQAQQNAYLPEGLRQRA